MSPEATTPDLGAGGAIFGLTFLTLTCWKLIDIVWFVGGKLSKLIEDRMERRIRLRIAIEASQAPTPERVEKPDFRSVMIIAAARPQGICHGCLIRRWVGWSDATAEEPPCSSIIPYPKRPQT